VIAFWAATWKPEIPSNSAKILKGFMVSDLIIVPPAQVESNRSIKKDSELEEGKGIREM